MLSAARKMMYENDDAVYEESLKKEAEETAIKIVNAILLKPFAELAEVYRKKEAFQAQRP